MNDFYNMIIWIHYCIIYPELFKILYALYEKKNTTCNEILHISEYHVAYLKKKVCF